MLQDLIDGFHCDCRPGYFGDQCDFDHDECASSPCVTGVCHVSICCADILGQVYIV